MYSIDWLLHFKSQSPRNLGKTIPQMLRKSVEESPDTTLQAFKNEIGSYEYQSYKLVYRHILNLAVLMSQIMDLALVVAAVVANLCIFTSLERARINLALSS